MSKYKLENRRFNTGVIRMDDCGDLLLLAKVEDIASTVFQVKKRPEECAL